MTGVPPPRNEAGLVGGTSTPGSGLESSQACPRAPKPARFVMPQGLGIMGLRASERLPQFELADKHGQLLREGLVQQLWIECA
jgi:hypothetical protein